MNNQILHRLLTNLRNELTRIKLSYEAHEKIDLFSNHYWRLENSLNKKLEE